MNGTSRTGSPSTRPKPLVAGLAIALNLSTPAACFATQLVTSCADSGLGSLRAAVNHAVPGDTVVFDTTAMACSRITLATALVVAVDDLTLQGPGTPALTIDGANTCRVFDHEGVGMLTIQALTIANGKVSASSGYAKGGCIYSKGDVELQGSTVTGCAAQGQGSAAAFGGAVYSRIGLHLQSSAISASAAKAADGNSLGGGAFTAGEAVLLFSTLSGNSTYSVMGISDGGGLVAVGIDTQILSSSIVGNQAVLAGGAVIGGSALQSANIQNSTISGNRAFGAGAGIIGSNVDMNVSNSTIAFNSAANSTYTNYTFAAGLAVNGNSGSVNLQSTIIANNTVSGGALADFNVAATVTVTGANDLIVTTLAGTTPPALTLTDDPMLGPLRNNGGPTLTHALQPGSPAIDHGNDAAKVSTDQRGPGYPRVFGAAADIGALETSDVIFAEGFDQ
jgi:hypothetical protein